MWAAAAAFLHPPGTGHSGSRGMLQAHAILPPNLVKMAQRMQKPLLYSGEY